jgi:hypothetical protein
MVVSVAGCQGWVVGVVVGLASESHPPVTPLSVCAVTEIFPYHSAVLALSPVYRSTEISPYVPYCSAGTVIFLSLVFLLAVTATSPFHQVVKEGQR